MLNHQIYKKFLYDFSSANLLHDGLSASGGLSSLCLVECSNMIEF